MCYKKLFIVILIFLLLTGCSEKIQAPSFSSTITTHQTGSAPSPGLPSGDASRWLKNPGGIDTFAFGEIQKVFLSNYYGGLSAGSPYIKDLLDKMVADKTLQHFSALITDVQKTGDSKFTLTIEKVKLNPKLEPETQGEEPFLSEKGESETKEVGSDVYIVLNMTAQVQMDEKLNDYIQPADGHYFDFYTCGEDTLFILEGVMP